ncbi:orotate phosphoribosyltransferase [Limnospira maxima CS-328]|uniref:Orotate phosphoribosyltransferase n=1 Tax=Limnospira maxima CS-328 TaxID=513049 RepID=B5VZG0_LIMMA|nr:bifunctional orotidine-5'-phosphate decarboxylase/orotate phosphoribosyltransferase [Limnospira maxima]EDZ95361.1 orotate phosphoribosyltransferase [Limnospira maxima CS-328]MDC0836169.1 bifunctional orotidine-5'-phosphate decarboxylase/orotate phosphoribosyltransferase [Limnoraphis robusta]
MNFFDKLISSIERNQSLLYVNLDPDPEVYPPNFENEQGLGLVDDGKLVEEWYRWLKAIVEQTANLVCAYKLTLNTYLGLGLSGWHLLQQILDHIPSTIPVILDAKHADLNSASLFARMIFTEWGVDACTVSPYTGQDLVTPFLVYPNKAVFVLCATANPSANLLQEYPNPGHPLYLELVRATQTWGTPEQVGLEVGVMADMLARIRRQAPERLILVQGNSAEENDLTEQDDLIQILAAGLGADGAGLLLPLPPRLLQRGTVTEAVRSLRDAINDERLRVMQGSPSCDLWLPDVCFLENEPHRDLILQLYDIGCIMFGDHVQSSGEVLPYYIDLRRIISMPQIFHQIVGAYAEILQNLNFDRIAGIPYGSLPTATGLSLRLGRPMVFPRKEVKTYGAKRAIEGHFQSGELVVVVDDILITGNSVMKGAATLQAAGLRVEDIVVFIDHGRQVMERLTENGYRGHAVLSLDEISQTLYQANHISSQQFKLFQQHI